MDLFLDLKIDRFWYLFETSKTVPKNGTISGSILGSIFWDSHSQMVVFEDKRWTCPKKNVPKHGPKNGLRKDSQMDYFGTHFRGTKMGHFSDLKNGPTQPKKHPNGSVWRQEMDPSENKGPKKWTQKWTPI